MDSRTDRKRTMGITVIVSLFLAVLMQLCPLSIGADPSITQSYTMEGDPGLVVYVTGVTGGDIQVDAYVDNIPCEISNYGLIKDDKDMTLRTYILFDNSYSISQKNREKAKEAVARIVENHADGEEFQVCTFSKDVTELAGGTDYSAIASAVRGITYADQDSYLASALRKVMSSMNQNDPYVYNRVILFSDGVDDESSGSMDSYISELEKEGYTCPIHTISSVWEKDRTGLKKLNELSKVTNGDYVQLDDYADGAEAASFCQKDYGGIYFMLNIPPELKDGEEKPVHFTISSQGKRAAVSKMMSMPELTEEEKALLAEQASVQTEEEPEVYSSAAETVQEEEEKPATISLYVPPEVNVEEPEPEEPSFFTKYRIPILCGAGALLLLSLILLIVSTRKRARMWDEPQMPPGFGEQLPVEDGYTISQDRDERWHDKFEADDAKTVAEYNNDGGPPTVGMFSSGIKVGLDETGGRNRHFEVEVVDEAVIGRRSPSNLIIGDDDPTVSKQHCRLISDINGLSVEDMGSFNGTFVNGTRVVGRQPLANGDTLKMGSLVCKVTISVQQ